MELRRSKELIVSGHVCILKLKMLASQKVYFDGKTGIQDSIMYTVHIFSSSCTCIAKMFGKLTIIHTNLFIVFYCSVCIIRPWADFFRTDLLRDGYTKIDRSP